MQMMVPSSITRLNFTISNFGYFYKHFDENLNQLQTIPKIIYATGIWSYQTVCRIHDIISGRYHQNGALSAFVLQVSFQQHQQSLISSASYLHPRNLLLPNYWNQATKEKWIEHFPIHKNWSVKTKESNKKITLESGKITHYKKSTKKIKILDIHYGPDASMHKESVQKWN